jgi:hypothetical protein
LRPSRPPEITRVSRLAVTTQVRHAGRAEYSGYLHIVDSDRSETLYTAPVPDSRFRSEDPNPRGGLRGAKGVSVHDGRFVTANADRVFVFDTSWRLLSDFTHPFLGSIHDLHAEEDSIWVTSVNSDLLLRFDWDGDLVDWWSWRADRRLLSELGFRSVPAFDPTVDFRSPIAMQGGVHNIAHLNGVARGAAGLILSFGRVLPAGTVRRRQLKAIAGRAAAKVGFAKPPPTKPTPVPTSLVPGSSFALVSLTGDAGPLHETTASLLLHVSGITVPNHNVLEVDSLLVYNDSNAGRLVGYDPGGRSERFSAPVPGSPSFARGLARLGDHTYAVGSQAPLAVHVIDLERARVERSIVIDGSPTESVYGICVLPDGFETPSGGSVFGS